MVHGRHLRRLRRRRAAGPFRGRVPSIRLVQSSSFRDKGRQLCFLPVPRGAGDVRSARPEGRTAPSLSQQWRWNLYRCQQKAGGGQSQRILRPGGSVCGRERGWQAGPAGGQRFHADLIAARVDICGAFDELDWDSPGVSGCLKKFSKTSLLAHFCYALIRIHDLGTARKDPEDLDVEDLESALSNYSIPFLPFKEFVRREFPDQQEDDYIELELLHPWMLAQEAGAFGRLWEKMTDEVFHLLFGNRGFLLAFNLQLAKYRRERGDSFSPRCPIPQWLKRAVYFT